jgi:hypothetical protein
MGSPYTTYGEPYSFEMPTDTIGPIYIGNLTHGARGELYKQILTLENTTPKSLALALLSILGRKINNPGEVRNELPITLDEASKLTEAELNSFADQFIGKNEWLFYDFDNPNRSTIEDEEGSRVESHSYNKIENAQQEGESSVDYLYRVFSNFEKDREKRWDKGIGGLFKSSNKGYFSDSFYKLLKQNQEISESLGSSLSKSSSESLSKPESLNTLSTRIADIKPPESPLVKTNEKLDGLVSNLEQMNLIVIESAALIKSMNDLGLSMAGELTKNARKGSRDNRILIIIGLATLIITAVFSILSYLATKDSNSDSKELIKAVVDQSKAVQDVYSSSAGVKNRKLIQAMTEQDKILDELQDNNLQKERAKFLLERLRELNLEIKAELTQVQVDAGNKLK